ncbi:ATP-binding protein [Pacificibacter sp.]|uniref:PAS domain-containing hybrid sensor histidine kinase/response regulator n=1 Tax=Pacificibacter sp. TaxID=1917866 RepID=UPI00321AAA3B
MTLIDVDDATLIQNLPRLAAMAQDARPEVRSLSNAGLNLFAQRADRQRKKVARTMSELAAALVALIIALGLGVIYLVRLNSQISQREKQQVQSTNRINTIMNTSLDGVIVSDADGRITGFNAAAEQIFGHKADDVMGLEIGRVIVPDHMIDAHNAGMQRMRKKGEKRVVGKGRVRLEAKRADGSLFPVELAIQSATADGGEIFIAFLRDVSQSVADEQELIQARDKAIAGEQSRSDFLATMSHEIRTPLNGLLGNMSLMRDTPLTAKQDKFMRNMETSGRLLMSHVSDVLDIARYDSGKLSLRSEPLNISALIQAIVDNQSGMASAQETTLDWGWDGPAQHWINGDSERLQHILMNLIGNAVKFTKHGRVSVTASWQDDMLRFVIEDTGIGIPPDLVDHVFDDFVTGDTSYARDAGGTGLGLGIVHRFVDALDGTITVDSAVGEGSTFLLELPTTLAQPQEEDAAAPPVELVTAPQNILIVEDNEMNRFVVRNMLIADGHHVTEAFDGKQGVELAYGQKFDLILMDISMPVMDGRTATVNIRKGDGASAKTRIIALTANALANEQADFLANGMDAVLIKPLTKSALRAALVGDSPAPTSVQSDLIDLPHLAETRAAVGTDGFAALHAKFDAEVEEIAQWFTPDAGLDTVAAKAHKTAGSAALFGALRLNQTLLALENHAKARDEAAVQKMRTEVLCLCQDTRDALTQAVVKNPM